MCVVMWVLKVGLFPRPKTWQYITTICSRRDNQETGRQSIKSINTSHVVCDRKRICQNWFALAFSLALALAFARRQFEPYTREVSWLQNNETSILSGNGWLANPGTEEEVNNTGESYVFGVVY